MTLKNIPNYQPSGICFHSKRGILFVVVDAGKVCEMRTDGLVINEKPIMRADFEGITHDPSTGLLYIAFESAAQNNFFPGKSPWQTLTR